ncbi:MAG: hypothetical protein D6732_16410 [Methanobacteriota archaeon]|nr:MAG: hypothetical protein D6732_16410 [Euryarchaeota archaeon]
MSSGITSKDEHYEEFHSVFIEEFKNMLDTYSQALRKLRNIEPKETRLEGFRDIFRIYHTIKGTAGYFQDYQKLSEFAATYCELFRNVENNDIDELELINWARKGFTQLSSSFFAIRRGGSVNAYRYILPPIN